MASFVSSSIVGVGGEQAIFPDTILERGFDQDTRVEPPGENRANATMYTERDARPISITLQRIDTALITYLRDKIKPSITDRGKIIVVPILYANAERWKQIRKDGVLRDNSTRVQTPLIMMHRTGVTRNPYTSPMNRYLDHTYQTGWNRHNSYDKFAVLNGIIPSRKLISTKVPDYINLAYDFMVWTDFIEQLNEIIEQINYNTDEYWGNRNDYKFKVTVHDYKTATDLAAAGDRYVKATFQLEAQAYLLPEFMIDTDKGVQATTQKRFTTKEVVNYVRMGNTTTREVSRAHSPVGTTVTPAAGSFSAVSSRTATPIGIPLMDEMFGAIVQLQVPTDVTEHDPGDRVKMDLTKYSQARIVVNVQRSGATMPSGMVTAQYSFDEATWSGLDGNTVGSPSISMDTTGTLASPWFEVIGTVRRDVFIRWVTYSGSNELVSALQPAISRVDLQVR